MQPLAAAPERPLDGAHDRDEPERRQLAAHLEGDVAGMLGAERIARQMPDARVRSDGAPALGRLRNRREPEASLHRPPHDQHE